MPGQRYCSVGSDNVLGGRRATLHLARMGRKKILFVGGSDPEAMQRRKGYLEGMRESGLDADPRLIVPVEFELEAAEAAVARLIHRGVEFDGIVASSDLIALGAIRALKRSGLAVPADVSVIGYDDMLLSRLSTPTLSTIRQDTAEAGRLLVSRVLDFSPDHSPVHLPTDLIVRESCGG
jgi:DNA-binding LacI/PurR family transcriptional regulator